MKNKLIITLFLLGTIAFTGLMTFYVGPRMMNVRQEVAIDKYFYKCQKVLSGSELEVQLRGWERPNTNQVFPIRLAGVDAPPVASAEDPALIAWAESHGLAPEEAARMGEAAHRTLLAFIRKQNLILENLDGQRAGLDLAPQTPVHVFITGTHVNRKLLTSGLAFFNPDTSGNYGDIYEKAAREAQQDKRALWSTL